MQAVMLSSGASAGMQLKAGHCNTRERHNSAGPLAAGLFPSDLLVDVLQNPFFFSLFVSLFSLFTHLTRTLKNSLLT